jgi:hypothetical protein
LGEKSSGIEEACEALKPESRLVATQ